MKNIKQFLLVGTLIFGGTLAMERQGYNNDFISPEPPVWNDESTKEPTKPEVKEFPGESEREKQYPVHALLEDLNKILANKELNPEKEFFYDNYQLRNLNILISYIVKKIDEISLQDSRGSVLIHLNSKNPYLG